MEDLMYILPRSTLDIVARSFCTQSLVIGTGQSITSKTRSTQPIIWARETTSGHARSGQRHLQLAVSLSGRLLGELDAKPDLVQASVRKLHRGGGEQDQAQERKCCPSHQVVITERGDRR